MIRPRTIGILSFPFFFLSKGAAFAYDSRTINVPGVQISIMDVLGKLVNIGVYWIAAFCATLFLIGALMKVGGAGKEEWAKKGNSIMIGAITGLAVVLLSYTIIRVVYFVIY